MYQWVMAGIATLLLIFGVSELFVWRRTRKPTDGLAALTWILLAACFACNVFAAPAVLLPLILLCLAATIGGSVYLRIRNDPTP